MPTGKFKLLGINMPSNPLCETNNGGFFWPSVSIDRKTYLSTVEQIVEDRNTKEAIVDVEYDHITDMGTPINGTITKITITNK